MKEILSARGEYLLGLKKEEEGCLSAPVRFAEYSVLFIPKGQGIFHADFGAFPFAGPVLLFSTPMQTLYLEQYLPFSCTMLQFHGDFYCIEFHRAEVSCNGLLFNNIYIQPCLDLTLKEAGTFEQLLALLDEEICSDITSEIVLRAYLQLFLAKSGSIKKQSMTKEQPSDKDEAMELFRQLLDEFYLTLHKPADYAAMISMSPNNFSKRCSRYYKKTPSQLIQERLILEANKQLHLTRKSIKEIAFYLKFEDEFYFSRVFKKFTHVSPQGFRDKTGISIMADLSM
jgi:AraC family transcriptional activator of pobA